VREFLHQPLHRQFCGGVYVLQRPHLQRAIMAKNRCAALRSTNFYCAHKKAREAWKLGRQEFKGRLRELMWRQAQRSIAMQIFLAKQWLGYTDKPLGGDLTPPPVALDNSESEDALTALIWAAKQANKRTNEGENGDK
jgi:hypothetical protein